MRREMTFAELVGYLVENRNERGYQRLTGRFKITDLPDRMTQGIGLEAAVWSADNELARMANLIGGRRKKAA